MPKIFEMLLNFIFPELNINGSRGLRDIFIKKWYQHLMGKYKTDTSMGSWEATEKIYRSWINQNGWILDFTTLYRIETESFDKKEERAKNIESKKLLQGELFN